MGQTGSEIPGQNQDISWDKQQIALFSVGMLSSHHVAGTVIVGPAFPGKPRPHGNIWINRNGLIIKTKLANKKH